MSWISEWNAIDARIEGLLAAGTLFVQMLGVNAADTYGVQRKYLDAEAREILRGLQRFLEINKNAMPANVASAITDFLDVSTVYIQADHVKGVEALKAKLIPLASIRSIVKYHLSDLDSVAFKRAERAFLHLKQSIVADKSVAEKWAEAFDCGEVACEKLGAAHLMLHGIWSFKIDAAGGRTDLVFGGAIQDANRVSAVADALVLTEWKVVREGADPSSVATSARMQTQLYREGILAGIEMSRYRYIVMVSKRQLDEVPDAQDERVTYRHVNISVSPYTPSRAAKKAKRTIS